jgi:hypothetical protein
LGRATAAEEAKSKTSFWAKVEDPVAYFPGGDLEELKSQNRPVVIVEDVHNTGESWIAFANMLAREGISVVDVVALASSDPRKTSERDIERISEKITAQTNLALDEAKTLMHELFDGSYKQFFNKAEKAITGNERGARRLVAFARERKGETPGRLSQEVYSSLFSQRRSERSSAQGSNDRIGEALAAPKARSTQGLSAPERFDGKTPREWIAEIESMEATVGDLVADLEDAAAPPDWGNNVIEAWERGSAEYRDYGMRMENPAERYVIEALEEAQPSILGAPREVDQLKDRVLGTLEDQQSLYEKFQVWRKDRIKNTKRALTAGAIDNLVKPAGIGY